MNDIKNCRKCNRIFTADQGAFLCKHCQREEEETFKRLREYLYDNPGTSIYDLSVQFKMSVRRIEAYIRDGRLNVV
jgi:hypothetical protein